jgi:HAD superfamily hydrolase (TIGR01509 family)
LGVGIPDLVIFDCDGVLVDSEAVSSVVLGEALSAAGVPTTADQAQARYRGMLLQDISEDVQARSGMALSEDFWVAFQRDRTVAFEKSLLPITGAAETVAAVKAAGIAVCVASQGKRAKTELTLGLTGLRSLFDDRAIFSAYDVARGKPHPDLFLYAAAQMQAPVKSCVVVEDTTIGVRAALAAEMGAIGLASGPEAKLMRHLSVTTIESLPDLLPLLKGLS